MSAVPLTRCSETGVSNLWLDPRIAFTSMTDLAFEIDGS